MASYQLLGGPRVKGSGNRATAVPGYGVWQDVTTTSGGSSISVSGISSSENFGSFNVSYIKLNSIISSGIASEETFGTAVVSSATPGQINCTGINSEELIGISVVSFRKALEVPSITSSEQFGITTLIRYPIIVSDSYSRMNFLRRFIGRR